MTTLKGIHKPWRNTAENHFLKKLQDSLAAWKKNKRNWWLKTFVYYYKLGHVSVFATYGVFVCLCSLSNWHTPQKMTKATI